MSSPYGQVGAKLVERGYAAIPAMPGTKRPGHVVGGIWLGMDDWRARYSARLPTDDEVAEWSDQPGAGVCVVTGPASGDLVGIDLDVDDERVIAAVMAVLPPTPVRKAGQKGWTGFYRGPGVISRSFNGVVPGSTKPQRLVDIIGPGRQTVLPPTVHPDAGEAYRWVGEVALENIDPADLPELLTDIGDQIAAALAPFGYRPAPPPRQEVDSDNPFRFVNDTALGALDQWVTRLGLHKLRPARGGYEAVATWRSSATNRPLDKRKRNLKIHPDGIRDMGADEAFTPLDLVIRASGCDFDTAFGQLVGWLGLATDIAAELAPKATHAQLDDGSFYDLATGEVIAAPTPAATAESAPSIDFVASILASSCLVGEIARLTLARARRVQPRLAIAAALSLVGTLASRQLVTSTDSNLNLYILLTARSGMGKDAPMKVIKSILIETSLMDMLGPDGVASDVGLLDYARNQPASVMPIDEFGDFLSSTTGQRASPHTTKIMATMRTLWDGGPIATTHARSRRSEMLINPCISMICASTPAQFYDAIGSAQVLNGFLNRFILFNGDDEAERGNSGRAGPVPDALKARVVALAERPGGLNAMRFRVMGECNFGPEGRPDVVPWRSEATRLAWEQYEDWNIARMKGDERLEAFAPRCPQNALRIATILAVAENIENPSVSERHVDIGIDVVETSLRDMLGGYSSHVPENPGAALAAKALQRIRDGGGSMSKRELFRSMKRGFKKLAEFDDMMKTLIEAGDVAMTNKVPEGGGPRTFTYHAVR